MNKLILVLPVIILISILFYYSKTDNKIFKGISTGNGPLNNRLLTVSKDGELIQSNSLNQIDTFHDSNLKRNGLNLMAYTNNQDAILKKYVNAKDASVANASRYADGIQNKQISDIKLEIKDLIKHINYRDNLFSRGLKGIADKAWANHWGYVVPDGKAQIHEAYTTKHIF